MVNNMITNKIKEALDKLDFKDIILQGYMMGRESFENEDELFNKYLIGYNLICTTFSSFGLYTLSDQDFYNILNELLGPYNDITTQTYFYIIIKRHQHLNNCKESEEYYEKYLKDFFERMKKRPVLIRFIDNSIIMDKPYYLLDSNTLNKYFELIDIDLYKLYTDNLYANTMFTIVKSFNCTSYKVLIIIHGNSDKDLNFMLSFTNPISGIVEMYDLKEIISFFKALGKPIDILNLCCYVEFSKYINELPEESLIIDVSNQITYLNPFLHSAYAEKEFQEEFYKNGLDFYKVLALYQLFNRYSTNNKSTISSKNSKIDIDIDIKGLQGIRDEDIRNNEFIKLLIKYDIITDDMLSCMIYVLNNRETNFSFYYSLAQYHIEMKEADFPNNIISKFSKYYYPEQDRKLKFVKIYQKLYESYLLDEPEEINPFKLLDNYAYIYKCTSYYSYQKFMIIVIKYIK
jgi:hypothetical protein